MNIYRETMVILTFSDSPEPPGLFLQNNATCQMEGLREWHNNIMFYLVIILFAVSWIMLSIVLNQNKAKISNYINHGILVELILTIIPALILVLIAFPSLKLLSLMDEIIDPSLVIYGEGHQWYWSYQYPYSTNIDEEFVGLGLHLVFESDLKMEKLRMLELYNQGEVLELTYNNFLLAGGAGVTRSYAKSIRRFSTNSKSCFPKRTRSEMEDSPDQAESSKKARTDKFSYDEREGSYDFADESDASGETTISKVERRIKHSDELYRDDCLNLMASIYEQSDICDRAVSDPAKVSICEDYNKQIEAIKTQMEDALLKSKSEGDKPESETALDWRLGEDEIVSTLQRLVEAKESAVRDGPYDSDNEADREQCMEERDQTQADYDDMLEESVKDLIRRTELEDSQTSGNAPEGDVSPTEEEIIPSEEKAPTTGSLVDDYADLSLETQDPFDPDA